MNICHVTSVHKRFDPRIFNKMCCSLAKEKDFNVSLMVFDGLGDESVNAVDIIDLGEKEKNRLMRIILSNIKLYKKCIKEDFDVYHIHDPELLFLCFLLKRKGYCVVFDSHEDFPSQILIKSYLNDFVSKIISKFASFLESFVCKKLDGVVGATPLITNKFKKINKNSVTIHNFPILDEFILSNNTKDKNRQVCYVGALSYARGVKEFIDAISLVDDCRLILAGEFADQKLYSEVKESNGWKSTTYHGWVDRTSVSSIISESCAGLITLHPTPTYIDSYPVKMFEYMAAGIPIIYSNFPLWKELVEPLNCGFAVDPLNPHDISNAIKKLLSDKNLISTMGRNGRDAVINKYNWDKEEKKLFEFYRNFN